MFYELANRWLAARGSTGSSTPICDTSGGSSSGGGSVDGSVGGSNVWSLSSSSSNSSIVGGGGGPLYPSASETQALLEALVQSNATFTGQWFCLVK